MEELRFFFREVSGSRATFDARQAPIFVTQFRGEIDLETAKWHATVAHPFFEAALRRGEPVFYITDARSMRTPSATVRRYWAEEMVNRRKITEQFLGIFIVLDNVLLRGALTAIQWLLERPDQLTYVATLDEAFREGSRRLTQAGFTPSPLSTERYEHPSL